MPPPAAQPERRIGRHLARVAGIDIEFHSSWIIILVLFGFSFAATFSAVHPGWGRAVVGLAALATTLLFFVSVVLHELSHSLVARADGLPVKVITLFVFGGVSQLEREPDNPSSEFRIAIAGPLSSVLLGGIFLGVARLGSQSQPVFAVAQWLGTINLYLAVFNLVPGFPLDGGRVLRAILWSANHNFLHATHWAARVGKGFAFLLILVGVGLFFRPGESLSGMWLAFIGWFLLTAAEQSWRQTEMRSALEHYTVRDLETPFYSRVSPERSLESYIDEIASQHQFRASLVMDDDNHLLGVITPADLGAVPRERWAETPVSERMVPRAQLTTVNPAEGLFAVLEKMMVSQVGQLPVVSDGVVRGVIRRDRILELVHAQLAPGRT